ncbi:cation channel sperm-associated protein 2 [Sorex fumeus]|uniref:cation channel sperm-associated protein 2 n=1 Tax=Sorex fumeus TaxID=62283 RepID=UPI0024AE7005|nr:cation channel sperm-associated protein 2 [Sorex fumeus]
MLSFSFLKQTMATHHQTQQKADQYHLLRAEAVRSRLIDTFSLIEHLQGLSQAVPRHTVREILDPSRQKKIMLGDQHQLVRFSIRPHHVKRITYSQRLLSRLKIRCSKRASLSLWAGWVLECPPFTNFIVFLIFLNTIVLMAEIELLEDPDETLWQVKLALESAAWFILLAFLLEIIIMWLFSFTLFWKNTWNVFDFIVTVLAVLPEVIVFEEVTGQPVWLQLLRICRVLRSLKFLAKFPQIRVIILALVRALKSMTFLLMLLLMFFYIFAVAGVYVFENYTRSTLMNLKYHTYFSNVLNSLVTVFILFTLDHWYAFLQDTWKVPEVSRFFSSIYVILWLLLGSIIFRNIIVAMMVTNFQNIRNELNEEMVHLEVQQKADLFKQQIIQRRQNLAPDGLRSITSKLDARVSQQEGTLSTVEVKTYTDTDNRDSSSSMTASKEIKQNIKRSASLTPSGSFRSPVSSDDSIQFDTPGYLDWETHVHQNLPGLMEMDQEESIVWPRDSLFRYFELLEKLQYNLEERKQLQEFAVQALMSFEDK